MLLSIVANKPIAHLVFTHRWIVATDITNCMKSSDLLPWIWWTTSQSNLIIMGKCSAQIREASRRCKQATKRSTATVRGGSTDSSNVVKSPENVLLVWLGILCEALLLTRMWLGYTSIITLWILRLRAFKQIGCVEVSDQLQITGFKAGMNW
jgi:hypothetical protein